MQASRVPGRTAGGGEGKGGGWRRGGGDADPAKEAGEAPLPVSQRECRSPPLSSEESGQQAAGVQGAGGAPSGPSTFTSAALPYPLPGLRLQEVSQTLGEAGKASTHSCADAALNSVLWGDKPAVHRLFEGDQGFLENPGLGGGQKPLLLHVVCRCQGQP